MNTTAEESHTYYSTYLESCHVVTEVGMEETPAVGSYTKNKGVNILT